MTLAGHETTANAPVAPVKDAKPRVSVMSPIEHDFGVMARNEQQSHTFRIKNIGSGPLTLKVLDTTCKCTVGSLEKDTIGTGEIADVTLTWEAKSYDREFRQSATIETNDQNQREIIFSVKGQVLQLAMPDLPRVKFSRISRSEPQSFTTNVYGYRDTDMVITDHAFSNESLGDFFSIETEPLPQEEWRDPNAKSAIKVKVNIKPGLPLGTVGQVIKLITNKPDIPPMDVVVNISIVSDISIIGGAQFDDEKNVLSLGPVSRATGKESRLFVIVKGVYKDTVDFQVESIDPEESLAVELGESTPIMSLGDDGEERVLSRRFPLSIIVKKDSPPVQRLGSKQGALGRIVFKTGHPEIPEFDIKVQYSVQ